MKSLTFKTKMEELHITSYYNRPRVNNDNPYVESLFQTLKYVPNWPSRGFNDLAASRAWIEDFVVWYNTEHKHSRLNYMTPSKHHTGKNKAILQHRAKVLMRHKKKKPERWSRRIRDYEPVGKIQLNPDKQVA